MLLLLCVPCLYYLYISITISSLILIEKKERRRNLLVVPTLLEIKSFYSRQISYFFDYSYLYIASKNLRISPSFLPLFSFFTRLNKTKHKKTNTNNIKNSNFIISIFFQEFDSHTLYILKCYQIVVFSWDRFKQKNKRV